MNPKNTFNHTLNRQGTLTHSQKKNKHTEFTHPSVNHNNKHNASKYQELKSHISEIPNQQTFLESYIFKKSLAFKNELTEKHFLKYINHKFTFANLTAMIVMLGLYLVASVLAFFFFCSFFLDVCSFFFL